MGCKYYKEKLQTTKDGGLTWVDEDEYRVGDKTDIDSNDCALEKFEYYIGEIDTPTDFCPDISNDWTKENYNWVMPSGIGKVITFTSGVQVCRVQGNTITRDRANATIYVEGIGSYTLTSGDAIGEHYGGSSNITSVRVEYYTYRVNGRMVENGQYQCCGCCPEVTCFHIDEYMPWVGDKLKCIYMKTYKRDSINGEWYEDGEPKLLSIGERWADVTPYEIGWKGTKWQHQNASIEYDEYDKSSLKIEWVDDGDVMDYDIEIPNEGIYESINTLDNEGYKYLILDNYFDTKVRSICLNKAVGYIETYLHYRDSDRQLESNAETNSEWRDVHLPSADFTGTTTIFAMVYRSQISELRYSDFSKNAEIGKGVNRTGNLVQHRNEYSDVLYPARIKYTNTYGLLSENGSFTPFSNGVDIEQEYSWSFDSVYCDEGNLYSVDRLYYGRGYNDARQEKNPSNITRVNGIVEKDSIICDDELSWKAKLYLRYNNGKKGVLVPYNLNGTLTKNEVDSARRDTNLEGVYWFEINDNVDVIGEGTFSEFILPSIEIPSSVKRIEKNAFSGCTVENSVTLNEGLEYIGDGAFKNLRYNRQIDVPSTVTEIGDEAFADTFYSSYSANTYGRVIRMHSMTPPKITSNTFYFYENADFLIQIPCEAYDAYMQDAEWAKLESEERLEPFGCDCDCQWNPYKKVKATITMSDGSMKDICGNHNSNDHISSEDFSGINTSDIVSLEVGDRVVYVDDYAFSGWSSLTSVTLHSDDFSYYQGVKWIGYGAFKDCTSLSEVNLEFGLEKILDYAFQGCTSLESITIPSGDGFRTDTHWGRGVVYIGDGAFKDCTSFREITFDGDALPMISRNGVFENTALESMYVSRYLLDQRLCDSYDNLCFLEYMKPLPTEVMYKATRANGDEIVGYCHNTNGVFSTSTEGIGNVVNITIYANCVDRIEDSAFFANTNIEYVTIEDGITDIGMSAFSNCRNLKEVKLPNTLTSIERETFYNCYELNLTIPSSVTSIGYYALTQLRSITLEGAPPIIREDSIAAFDGNIFIHCDYVEDYLADEKWYNFKDKIIVIEDDCFSGNKLEAVLDDGTTYTIGCSFDDELPPYLDNRDKMVSAVIGDCVRVIGRNAFYEASKLTSVTIGENVEEIEGTDNDRYTGYGAFGKCTALTNLDIPKSVTNIHYDSFQSCSNLTLKFLGDEVLNNMSGTLWYVKAIMVPFSSYNEWISKYDSYKTKIFGY